MFCRKSGFKLPDDSYFCSKCGANLQNNTSQGDDSIETSFSKDDVKISVEDRISYIREHFGDIPNYEEDYSLKVNNPQKWYLPFHTFKELNNMSGRSTRKDFNICDAYFWLSYGVIITLNVIGRENTKENVRYEDYYSYRGYNTRIEYTYGKTIGSQIAICLSVIFMLYLAYKMFKVTIRRAHDLGISGELCIVINILNIILLGIFSPIGLIVSIGWGIYLTFFRGEQKENEYGVDPLKYIPIEKSETKAEDENEINKPLTTKDLLLGKAFANVNRISKDEFAVDYTFALLRLLIFFISFCFLTVLISMLRGSYAIMIFFIFFIFIFIFIFGLSSGINGIDKRIHDSGISVWCGYLIFFLLLITFFIIKAEVIFFCNKLHIYSVTYFLFVLFVFVCFLLIPYLFLLFPESKEPNQYGSPRGKLNIDPNDKFLVFIVKILRKCHLVSHE